MTEPLTDDHAALIRELIGDAEPATDSLIKSLAVSFRDRVDHEHPKYEDLFCVNQACWSGERMAYVLRRLVDAEVEVARLREELAVSPAQPSPEHQAVYLDEYDQVWCDYPTVPAGDDVLPLVWASEQAQSRRELADGGNKLRVIGWCR